ncbi:Checkpoint kinase 2 [Tritrichomonas musculus]|uniref:Checkpoint kinase 2 n=1 Tax=Tritrichomonas musculus TaxID=1915356 RepID=A0ABR2H2B8_9EUKA
MASQRENSRSMKRSNDYLIDLSNYEIVQNITQGGFGDINLIRNKKTGKEFAAKTNLIQNKTQNKLFISREVRILIQIQHPTIIQFRGFSYVDFREETVFVPAEEES